MRENTMNVLLKLGMPASVKGMTYICDAIELFDTDPYYADGKIGSLYGDIARMHNTTSSGVERAIRHAFEMTLERGEPAELEHYLDVTNTQNSNLLRVLYFRMSQEMHKKEQEKKGYDEQLHIPTGSCTLKTCAMKEQICQEAMTILCNELANALAKHLGSM